ncbi:MAG: hypothetical protein OHK0046_32580 [Anaerolineae bacterium]
MNWLIKIGRTLLRLLKYSVGLVLFLFFVQRSTYPLYLNWNAVSAIVREHQFDYVTWEVEALAAKAGQALWGTQGFMSEAERSQTVRDYMVDLTQAQMLEGQISAVYADPAVSDADAATAALRQERDTLRASLRERQTLVESILEGQVAAILVEEGFGTLGQLTPPISMRFTQMPNLLVVSPRDRIDRVVELVVDPLPVEEIVHLEERILAERDMAALIVPLGGMALFPAMIQETTSIQWAVETFAHEWVHHYFFFYPLGANYFTNAGGAREAVIINETTADTFGKEIREKVLRRYYPDLAAQVNAGHTRPVNFQQQAQAQPFDFGQAMHVTRVIVDKTLADVQILQGKTAAYEAAGRLSLMEATSSTIDHYVAASETFMEARRKLLYDNGWRIRKLNQAYFAFYGGYQAGGRPGVGGADPIGPAVADIRAMSPTIRDFIVTMRGITTREELLRVRDAMRGAA